MTKYIFIDPDHGDDFMECGECNRKPGSPVMCRSCLHNRDLISKLKAELRSAFNYAYGYRQHPSMRGSSLHAAWESYKEYIKS